jgi:predicted nucleic acid-binding protein
MKVLLDTNVIVRAAQPSLPVWPEIDQALTTLIRQGFALCVVPQNLYEFWVVATRPSAQNGFGLSAQDAKSLIESCLTKLILLRDERGVFDYWMSLVDRHAVLGKNAHDARLVAAMQRHSITNLLTMNKSDFVRFSITALTPQEINAGVRPTTYLGRSAQS